MAREVDILRRIMENLPPDRGGQTKTASSQIDDLVNDALLGLGKSAQEGEEGGEKKEDPPMETAPPEEKKSVEEKADEKAEEKKDGATMDEETKEALASIGAAFIQQYPHLLADNSRHVKVAASAVVAKDEFMQKVAAEALADEMAKIAYAEMAGMSFEEYLEKVSGRIGAAREAVSGAARNLGGGFQTLGDAARRQGGIAGILEDSGQKAGLMGRAKGALGLGAQGKAVREYTPGMEDVIRDARIAAGVGGAGLLGAGAGAASLLGD